MKKFASFLAVATALSLVATSCKDDDDDKSRTQYLTDHSWVFEKIEMKVNGATTIPLPADEYDDTCAQDNILTFTTDFKFTNAPGADDCDGTETTTNGTWAWKNGESTLSITVDGDAEDVTINELNGSTLRISLGEESVDINGDGVNETTGELLITFKSH